MKAILMSVDAKGCELIFSGRRRIEPRKTAPKETPFKVYVYCTKERMTRVPSMYAYLHKNEPRACAEYGTIEKWGEIGDVIVNPHLDSKHLSYGMHGKVVGEFVCDKVIEFPCETTQPHWLKEKTCLSDDEYMNYLAHKDGKGLYITKTKLYDKPKELEDFWSVRCTNKTGDCEKCKVKPACINNITRPPQSWCYLGEVVE